MKTQMQLVQEALARLSEMNNNELKHVLDKAGLTEPESVAIFSSTIYFSQEIKSINENYSLLMTSNDRQMSMSLAF
ncbi:hypothetical protein ACSMDF_04745 [Yersinia enterocolitica]|nr:hypothetical protein [Yersinia enterocolitica]